MSKIGLTQFHPSILYRYVHVVFVCYRRWQKERGAGDRRQTAAGRKDYVDRLLDRDDAPKPAGQRHGDGLGRAEHDPQQRAGRRALAADTARPQVLDGKLVHRGRADRSLQPDILSGGQPGRMRGKFRGAISFYRHRIQNNRYRFIRTANETVRSCCDTDSPTGIVKNITRS